MAVVPVREPSWKRRWLHWLRGYHRAASARLLAHAAGRRCGQPLPPATPDQLLLGLKRRRFRQAESRLQRA